MGDELRSDELEMRHSARFLVKQTYENLEDLGNKVPADMLAAVRPRLEALEKEINVPEDKIEYLALKKALEDLRFIMMRVAQRVYGKQRAPDNQPGPAAPRAPGGTA